MRRDITELTSPYPSTERRRSFKHSEPRERHPSLQVRETHSLTRPEHAHTWPWTSPAPQLWETCCLIHINCAAQLWQAQRTGTREQRKQRTGLGPAARRYRTPLDQLPGCIGAAPQKGSVTKMHPPLNSFPPTHPKSVFCKLTLT